MLARKKLLNDEASGVRVKNRESVRDQGLGVEACGRWVEKFPAELSGARYVC
jgi:hypothetical protein